MIACALRSPGEPPGRRVGPRVAAALVLGAALGASTRASAAPDVPPVLLDPRGASAAAPALIAADLPRQAAELAILLQDPRLALEAAARAPRGTAEDEARRARLELDAFVLSGDRRLAEDRMTTLERAPGWGAHVRRARAGLELAERTGSIARGAGLVYALAFAFLVLGAGRELLRIGSDTLIFAGVLAGALVLARPAAAAWATGIGVAGSAMLVLVHATSASARRLAPRPRVRLLLALTLVLGAVGATAAVAARLDPVGLAAALSL